MAWIGCIIWNTNKAGNQPVNNEYRNFFNIQNLVSFYLKNMVNVFVHVTF